MTQTNHLGQPVGFDVPGWATRPAPPRTAIEGRFCRVEPLDPERHAAALHAAYRLDTEDRMWTYLPTGPYPRFEDYLAMVRAAAVNDQRLYCAIVDQSSGKAVGEASYLSINPRAGSIEVGGLAYSPLLQRRPAATEAMYMMMRRIFGELGYRRYEWKCNALNAASRAAALRLGFRFEGIFRQADVVKGRNRDTAWFAIADAEWPRLRDGFERWLDPGNFDAAGQQRVNLSALTARD